MAVPVIAQPSGVGTLCDSTNAFQCKVTVQNVGSYRFVKWRFFYVRCPKVTVGTTCNSTTGAYVAAITVCNEQLWANGYCA